MQFTFPRIELPITQGMYACRLDAQMAWQQRNTGSSAVTGAKHTSPAVAELVDGDAGHEQHQSLPLPHCEVPLQYEPHQQCYHQNLQGVLWECGVLTLQTLSSARGIAGG